MLVAPASGLGDHSQANLGGQGGIASGRHVQFGVIGVIGRRAGIDIEGPFRREGCVDAVGESLAEVGVQAEVLEGLGHAGVDGGPVLGDGGVDADGPFEVPSEELEPVAVVAIPPDVVVLVWPVGVADVHGHDHVVDVVVDVDVVGVVRAPGAVGVVSLDPLVGLGGRDALADQGKHGVPGGGVPIDGVAGVEGVPGVLVATEVVGVERGLWPLAGIVEAPVEAVDVEVDKVAVGGGLAQGELGLAAELVADVLDLVCRGSPGVAVVGVGAEGDRIEFLGHAFVGPEDRILEFRGPVLLLEQQAEGVLVRHGGAAEVGPALNAQAGVDLEGGGAVGIDPLDGGGPFPGDGVQRGVGVDAGGLREETVLIGDDREGGQRPQRVDHQARIEGVGRDSGVHFVVGRDRAAGEVDPRDGETGRLGRLGDHVLEEEVGMGSDARGLVSGLEGSGPKGRGGADRDGGGIDAARGCGGRRAVEGVANLRTGVGRTQDKLEGRLVEAAGHVDGHVVQQAQRAGHVGRSGGGRGEIAELVVAGGGLEGRLDQELSVGGRVV
ncbi:MAG: hypothetical protein BWX88_04891 [Planctomycetes bacterium ADurb.Bin126]|nr:MAG: hypothetical protein BWX88_04891 [Planctomycetes bacterium ADurb.Bin126]